MAISYVQSVTASADTNPVTTSAFASSTSAGQLIVVNVVGDGGVTPTVTGVTDNKGNTYTVIPGSSFGNGLNMVAYMTVISTGGSGHTLTVAWNDAAENVRVVAQVFTGFTGTPTFDQLKQASGSSATPASGSTSTTSTANELVVGMLARAGTTASTITAGSGYSNLVDAAATDTAAMESQVVSSTGGYNATFSLSVSRAWLAMAITFYDDTGGGGGGPSGPSGPTAGNFLSVF